MLLTQTFQQLGEPKDLVPVGIYLDDHGQSIVVGLEKLRERFAARFPGFVVLNVRLETFPGGSHPSYNCRVHRVTGDLYQNVKTTQASPG